YLRMLGVGAEQRVGLCVERGVEMVVGLLGVLKAGGAYVPLDPGYPRARLEYMVKDAEAEVVVTRSGLRELLQGSVRRMVCLDLEGERIAAHSQQNLAPLTRPENLAYVIYTSGSTGLPKGVAIEHRSVINYVNAIKDRTGSASFSFAMLQ